MWKSGKNVMFFFVAVAGSFSEKKKWGCELLLDVRIASSLYLIIFFFPLSSSHNNGLGSFFLFHRVGFAVFIIFSFLLLLPRFAYRTVSYRVVSIPVSLP